jgi:polyhydroxyalkanoate synthesis regulator phasin
VAVELGSDGIGRVSIGDLLVAGDTVHAAIDPLTIKVGGLATITVTPARTASAADQKKRQAAQTRLSKLLEDAGVATQADLRASRARREALEAEAAGLQAELNMLGIAEPSPSLAIEGIKTEIAEIDELVSDILAQIKADDLPTLQDISVRQDGLRLNREDARRKRQLLDGAITSQNAILSGVADSRGRVGGALTEIQNRLQGDLAIVPDSDRVALIAEAERVVGAAQDDYRPKAAALEEQRQKAPSQEELERRTLRADRLKSALENQRTRLASLEREIAHLEGQIQSAGGDGLGEKVEELRQIRDLTEREVEKYKGRVEMLLLLRAIIETCYKEQRDRIHAPLRRHLKPFLSDIFPAAEIELGDGFTIAGFRRSGPSAETFERLSTGTQEQIAVLVRLAMGAMICERGQPVPIILDDALVFSDDDRIEQMFDALSRAGQKQQVIVLTCRTRTFARLGGRQLSISIGPNAAPLA